MLAWIKSMIVLCYILSLWEVKFFSRSDSVKCLLLLQQWCFVYIFIDRAFALMTENGFLQSLTPTSIEESIQLGKNELDSIVAHMSWLNHCCKLLLQQQILLIVLCKLAIQPELKENLNSQIIHIFLNTYWVLLSSSHCSGPLNQFWHRFGGLWIPSELETIQIPCVSCDHKISCWGYFSKHSSILGVVKDCKNPFSTWLNVVLSTHWRK